MSLQRNFIKIWIKVQAESKKNTFLIWPVQRQGFCSKPEGRESRSAACYLPPQSCLTTELSSLRDTVWNTNLGYLSERRKVPEVQSDNDRPKRSAFHADADIPLCIVCRLLSICFPYITFNNKCNHMVFYYHIIRRPKVPLQHNHFRKALFLWNSVRTAAYTVAEVF